MSLFCRMRDTVGPEGPSNLPYHRQKKVDPGSAIPRTTTGIAQAQAAAKHLWQIEQLESSFMWLLPELLALEGSAWKAGICVDETQWKAQRDWPTPGVMIC